jgi:hypothetical protein
MTSFLSCPLLRGFCYPFFGYTKHTVRFAGFRPASLIQAVFPAGTAVLFH